MVCNIWITDWMTSTAKLLSDLNWDTVAERRKHHQLTTFNKYHFTGQNIVLSYSEGVLHPKDTITIISYFTVPPNITSAPTSCVLALTGTH